MAWHILTPYVLVEAELFVRLLHRAAVDLVVARLTLHVPV